MSSRLKKRYNEEIKKQLNDKFKYANPMLIPQLRKVVINMGLAEVCRDKNAMQDHVNELTVLAGQKAVATKSRKSISNFKLREGMPVGARVTLRADRMYDFVERLVNIAAPRILDFRGFEPKGDRQGNVSIGITDQQIFPEIDLDAVKRSQGMTITFVTTAETDEEALELLRLLGVPFKNMEVVVATAA
jgi:large subunit ribosomal protein L5